MPHIKIEHRTIINAVARRNGLPSAALLAVVEVESGGRVGTMINGHLHPMIRFEGHYFDRRLEGQTRLEARNSGLASPSAGTIKNPRTQKARYKMLARAKAINTDAAIESTSWGVGQVMGSHWHSLNYESAADFAAQMQDGLAGQVEAMVRFIVANKLDKALRSRDWKTFARRYNGPAYAKNKYDIKLARAYNAYTNQGDAISVLSAGAFGFAVRTMQEKLTKAGYDTRIDGQFGAQTVHALIAFQRAYGLVPDGLYGSVTAAALNTAQTIIAPKSKLNRLIAWLSAFIKQYHTSKY